MSQLHHVSVEIDATFGSQFQEAAALRMLGIYLRVWKEFYLEKHSKNAIEFHVRKDPFEQQRRAAKG